MFHNEAYYRRQETGDTRMDDENPWEDTQETEHIQYIL